MSNFGGRIGMTYSEVTATITKFGNTRQEIYSIVEQIRQLIEESSSYWKGDMADSSREVILEHAKKCYNCGKWINEWAWTLQQYADRLKEQDQAAASRMQGLQD